MAKKNEKLPKEITIKMGRDPLTRRFSRSLAIAARNYIPPEVLLEWLGALLAGHGQATIVPDARCDGGFRVHWPERGELESTHEQKAWAWTQLRQAGYGMPAQQIHLEAELRAELNQASSQLDLVGKLSPQALETLYQTLKGELPSAGQTGQNNEAIDAEFTDHVNNASQNASVNASEATISTNQGTNSDTQITNNANESSNKDD